MQVCQKLSNASVRGISSRAVAAPRVAGQRRVAVQRSSARNVSANAGSLPLVGNTAPGPCSRACGKAGTVCVWA